MWGNSDVATMQTDGLEVLETREWVDSLDYVLSKGGPRPGRPSAAAIGAACSPRGRHQPALLRRPRRTRTRFLRARSLPFPEARRWSAASRAWFAGTLWPWWFAPTRCRKASAGTSRRLPPPPRSMKLPSTISSARKPKMAIATSSTSRVTPRPESTHAPFSKAASPKRSWRTSAAN